jgi:ferric-dicitrate binding protein FerR (iron transport regulator)
MQQESNEQRLNELAAKWLDGSITPEEAEEYARWYNAEQDAPVKVPEELAFSRERHHDRILQQVEAGIEKEGGKVSIRPVRLKRWLAAASVIALLGVGGYLLYMAQSKKTGIAKNIHRVTKDIAPGHDGAILTLADGSTVVLDSIDNGAIARQGGSRVIKQNGQLIYEAEGQKPEAGSIGYNTMSTPRGRRFQVTLPDGTKVWLNAASSIKYPTAFTGGTRSVEISGEAYFEVTKNAALPFIVTAGQTEVTVLGTHFDVMAYKNEKELHTTLLEGAVRVKYADGQAKLTPGQQAAVSYQTGHIAVKSADTEEAVAWVNGQLVMGSADVESLMREISRWYDVDVSYEGAIPQRRFWAVINRNVYLSEVLKELTANGLHARQEGKTIIISGN